MELMDLVEDSEPRRTGKALGEAEALPTTREHQSLSVSKAALLFSTWALSSKLAFEQSEQEVPSTSAKG